MNKLAACAAAAVTGVTLLAPAAAYADTGTTTSTCGALPGYVQGQPLALHAGAAAGDYIWHDSTGWHVRVTHANNHRMVFAGVINASNPMRFKRVADESRDKVWLSNGGKTLAFRFVNYGRIDGVDFTDACATTMRVGLTVDGSRLGVNHIYLGRHSARPVHDPFTISRRQPTSAA